VEEWARAIQVRKTSVEGVVVAMLCR